MRELRAALETLRTDDGEQAERAPQPGLAARAKLLESASTAGLSVNLRVDGEEHPLSPEVDLASYRILQEALTNAARHAGSPAVEVRLGFEPDALHLTVTSHGRRSAQVSQAGNGLVGMRERTAALGGTVTITDGAAAFVVDAVLPYLVAPIAGRR